MFKQKGQSTAEYAILIALIVAGAIAMQTYLKRGFQGGVKYTVDRLSSGTTNQYEPYYLNQTFQSTQEGYKDTEETKTGGYVNRIIGADGTVHKTSRTGNQIIANADAQESP